MTICLNEIVILKMSSFKMIIHNSCLAKQVILPFLKSFFLIRAVQQSSFLILNFHFKVLTIKANIR